MKLKTIKTHKEIEAALRASRPGRPFLEVVSLDGSIKALRINDLHVRLESYSFVVSAERNIEIAPRYKLIAKTEGFQDQVTYHDDSSAAYRAAEVYARHVTTDVIGPVDCEINNDGDVIREHVEDNPAQPAVDGDVPF